MDEFVQRIFSVELVSLREIKRAVREWRQDHDRVVGTLEPSQPARCHPPSVDARDEALRYLLDVAVPVGSVFPLAARDVAPRAMKDHDHEEDRVEIGQEVLEAADQAP